MFVFFLAVLVALRIVPVCFGGVLPFSREVKTVWAERARWPGATIRINGASFSAWIGWILYLLVAARRRMFRCFLGSHAPLRARSASCSGSSAAKTSRLTPAPLHCTSASV